MLGKVGNAGAVLGVVVDMNSVSKGTLSVPRFSYNTVGALGSIGVGFSSGGPYGALVGSGFAAGQMAYDGIIVIGENVARSIAQFNNAWRNGWVPGMR